MLILQGTQPISGTSFARLAAELGLTTAAQSHPKRIVPAQPTRRRGRIEVTAR
ncbi:MAG TPA: hypothetical protein VLR26_09820 [Frankiaceae bacterium]|nr:hypothetical protein [Frankiaceae bacterium]